MNLFNLSGFLVTLVLFFDLSLGGVMEQAKSEVFIAKNNTSNAGESAKLATSLATYTKIVNGNSLNNSNIEKGIAEKYSEDSTWVISDKVNSSDIQKATDSTFRNSSDPKVSTLNNGNSGPNGIAIKPGGVKNSFAASSWTIKTTDKGVTIQKVAEGNMWALNQKHLDSRWMHRSADKKKQGRRVGKKRRRLHGKSITNRDNPDNNTRSPHETE